MHQAMAYDWRPPDLKEERPPAEPNHKAERLNRLLRDVLQGIRQIHSVGLLHCDLKPQNVLGLARIQFQLFLFSCRPHTYR